MAIIEGYVYKDGGYWAMADGSGPYVFDGATMTLAGTGGGGGGGTQYQEDAVASSGATGTLALAVRADTAAANAANGDFAWLQVDSTGRLWVSSGPPSTSASRVNVTSSVTEAELVTAAQLTGNKAVFITNDSAYDLLLGYGTTVVTTTDYSLVVPGGATLYELPLMSNGQTWQGSLRGKWTTADSGGARFTICA